MLRMIEDMTGPSELELMLYERHHVIGFDEIGPLTARQAEGMSSWEDYCERMVAEFDAQEAAGGRTICPDCGERSVVHATVLTYGTGAAGSEYSGLATCERTGCGYRDLAG